MFKKYLPVLFLPLLLAGCTTTITNLTPQLQTRRADNLYPVEVALDSSEQALLWETIRPQILVGGQAYPMRLTPLMTNRWEGLLPVPASQDAAHYRYEFDYDYNTMGGPRSRSLASPEYTLRILQGVTN